MLALVWVSSPIPKRALDLERRPDQLLGFLIAALLDQNRGKTVDEAAVTGLYLPCVLEHVEQCAPRVGLGFAQAALAAP